MAAEEDVGPTDVANHLEELARPFWQRSQPLDQFRNLIQTGFVEIGQRVTVDQRGRPLVAHAGAGGDADRDPAIGAGFTDPDTQPVAEVAQQLPVTEHPVGDVVAEENIVGTMRLGVEKGIKLSDSAHFVGRNADGFGYPVHGFGREPGPAILDLAQDLQQPSRQAVVALHDLVNSLSKRTGFRHGPPPSLVRRSAGAGTWTGACK